VCPGGLMSDGSLDRGASVLGSYFRGLLSGVKVFIPQLRPTGGFVWGALSGGLTSGGLMSVPVTQKRNIFVTLIAALRRKSLFCRFVYTVALRCTELVLCVLYVFIQTRKLCLTTFNKRMC